MNKQGKGVALYETQPPRLGSEHFVHFFENIQSREIAADARGRMQQLERENAMLRRKIERLVHGESMSAECARLARLVVDRLPAMIAYWDRDERCQFANGAYKDWFGVTPEDLRGKTMMQLLGPRLYQMNEPYIRGALDGGEPQQFERVLRMTSGEVRYSQALYIPDMDGPQVCGMFVLVTDVTKIKHAERTLAEANERLKRETITDQLTGLRNRRYFVERSRESFSRYKRLGEPYALLLIDVDFFKSINDRFGHDAGDGVLRAIAQVLTSNTRADIEVPARIGGEEFAVFCYGHESADTIAQVGERLRKQVAAEALLVDGAPVRLSVSVGGSLSSEHDAHWDAVYRRADRALYLAKERGRDQVAIV